MSNSAHDALQNLGENADENTRELARRYQTMFVDPLVLEDLKRKYWFYDSPLDERFTEARVGSLAVIQYILGMLSLDTSKEEPVTEGENT